MCLFANLGDSEAQGETSLITFVMLRSPKPFVQEDGSTYPHLLL
jgi:hypothetical protein